MQSRSHKSGLITGDKEGKVIVWDLDHGEIVVHKRYDVSVPDLKSMMPSVKSVSDHPKTGQILVGTRGGEIVEFGAIPKERPKMHLKSHYHKELKGLAPHPTEARFLTVGQDGMLGVWNINGRRQ
jgi:hypothetical protein